MEDVSYMRRRDGAWEFIDDLGVDFMDDGDLAKIGVVRVSVLSPPVKLKKTAT